MTAYEDLISTSVSHYGLDETSGNVAIDARKASAWRDFSDADYLEVSTTVFDSVEYRLDLRGYMYRAASMQCLVTQGGQTPWTIFLHQSGDLRIGYRSPSGAPVNTLTTFSDGEYVDISIYIRSATNEFEVVDNISSAHDVTISADIHDNYPSAYEFRIGRYRSTGYGSSAVVLERIATYTADDTPQHEWDFNKHKTKDQIGSNDLVLIGNPTFNGAEYVNLDPAAASVAGLLSDGGTAIAFDGVDQHVDLGSRSATSEQTLSFWVAPGVNDRHVLQWGKVAIEIKPSTNSVTYWPNTDSTSVSFACDLSSAVHVGVEQVGTTATFYCNGVAVETKDAVAINIAAASSYLGGNGSTYFDGVLDSVIVFDRALTEEEVYTLKSFQASVLLNCDLQETSGTNFLDVSEHGNDVTAQGGLAASQHSVAGPGGLFPAALALDGANHFLSLPDIPILGAWTCSIWSNGRHADRSSVLFGKSDQDEKLGFYAGEEQMLCRADNGSSACVVPIDVNTFGWHLYTFVRESNNDLRLYVDATDQGVIGTSVGSVTHFDQIGLGDASDYHQASIAGVLIADYAFTSEEVATRFALATTDSIPVGQPRDFLKVKQVRRSLLL